MQTQQPNRPQQETQPSKAAQVAVSPQPWVKPTFEQVPLNDALNGPLSGNTTVDGNNVYTALS